MKLIIKDGWILRSALCAVVSAFSLAYLEKQQSFYWAPGVAFALLVVSLRSRRPELWVAVALSYGIAYASGDWFEPMGKWPMRVAVVALGSGLLALSLRWRGGLGKAQTLPYFLLGTALAFPFWWCIDHDRPHLPNIVNWSLAFAVWQMPMAWYYVKKS